MRRSLAHAIALVSVCGVLAGCVTPVSRSTLASEYYNIGTAYFDLGKLDKSATYLSRAIELAPELARASYNLARVYIEQKRYADAIDLLTDLLADDETNVLVIETIGYAHYQAGDLDDAGAWYDRAL